MLARYFPTRVYRDDAHWAKNRPFLIRISYGCTYYAAVRAQELYEALRATAWFTGGIAAASAAGGALGSILGPLGAVPGAMLGAGVFSLTAGRLPFPTLANRSRRELMGQAIEIAAVKLIYGAEPAQVETSLFFNARSIAKPSSSYQRKGYFPELRKVPYEPMRAEAFFAGEKVPARIALAMSMLKSVEKEAEAWVRRHEKLLFEWQWDERANMASDQYNIPSWRRG